MRENEIFAPPAVDKFLKAAYDDPNKPIERVARKNGRDTYITGIYYATPATFKEIGEIFGVTRARPEQIVKATMGRIWEYSSEELQKNIPLETILVRKPTTLKTRLRMSKRNARLYIRVEKLIQEGVTYEELKRKLHRTGSELGRLRTNLKPWDVDVPYTIRHRKKDNILLAQKLELESDDSVIRQLLSQVDFSFYDKDRASTARLLMPVKEAASGYFFSNIHTKYFIQLLLKSDIPVRTLQREIKKGPQKGSIQNYHLILTKHKERAITVFNADSSLDKYREGKIYQICGPHLDTLPTTWDLENRTLFRAPSVLLKDMGISVSGNSRFSLSDMLPADCPVRIIKYNTTYHYYTKDEKTLRRFFRERYVFLSNT